MKIPNRDQAYIPASKLKDYLLSENHSVGKSKAKFFRLVGFDETNASVLEKEFINLVKTTDYQSKVSSPFGEKYSVTGTIQTPLRNQIEIQTIWIIEVDDNRPRFVTAYPTS